MPEQHCGALMGAMGSGRMERPVKTGLPPAKYAHACVHAHPPPPPVKSAHAIVLVVCGCFGSFCCNVKLI